MKKSKLLLLLGVVVMSMAMVLSACKKDDDDPAPTPTPTDPCDTYVPSFSPTYLVIQGNPELLDFYITCVTDDWEMIKCIVTYPGGLGSEEYIGSGQIVTQGSPFTFSNYFPKLGGLWSFAITGNIKSGNCVNKSFTVTAQVNVTGK